MEVLVEYWNEWMNVTESVRKKKKKRKGKDKSLRRLCWNKTKEINQCCRSKHKKQSTKSKWKNLTWSQLGAKIFNDTYHDTTYLRITAIHWCYYSIYLDILMYIYTLFCSQQSSEQCLHRRLLWSTVCLTYISDKNKINKMVVKARKWANWNSSKFSILPS